MSRFPSISGNAFPHGGGRTALGWRQGSFGSDYIANDAYQLREVPAARTSENARSALFSIAPFAAVAYSRKVACAVFFFAGTLGQYRPAWPSIALQRMRGRS